MGSAKLLIKGLWGARQETPAQIGQRMVHIAETLSPLDPLLRAWNVADAAVEQDFVPLERAKPYLAPIVEARVSRNDFGEPEPENGYTCTLSNDFDDPVRSVLVRARAGVGGPPGLLDNMAMVETPWRLSSEYEPGPADPRLMTLPVVTSIMQAVIDIFEATAVMACLSGQIKDPWPDRGPFNPAWMLYLSAPHAAQITPPSDLICEQMGDGLLMIATEQPFDLNNPEHIAAGRAISAATRPLQPADFGRQVLLCMPGT